MKRLLILCLVILGVAFIAPVLAHHMAEGIISDEIWDRVDLQLDGTPHDVNVTAALDSMTPEMSDDGDWTLESSIEVETIYAQDYLDAVDTVILEMEDERQRIPSGTRNSVDPEDEFTNLLVLDVDNLDTGMTTISIYEPIGAGASQDGSGVTTPPSGNGGNR